jgi:hypothetical protein
VVDNLSRVRSTASTTFSTSGNATKSVEANVEHKGFVCGAENPQRGKLVVWFVGSLKEKLANG